MKRRSLVFLLSLHVAATMGSAQTSTAQFERWFEQVSNHGRWGADDELGTLNFITPERMRRAAGLVRDGVSISLSRELKPGENLNAIAPLANSAATEPQALKSATLPIVSPLKAFIACVAGSSRATLPATSGNMLYGNMIPASRIDGMKNSCD